jgi:ATP-dependent DNA helicase DinG
MICWIEKQGKINALCALPKRLNEILSQHVWNVPMPYILTSGTISVKGNFDLLKIRTGISQVRPERIIEMNKPSPFDFRKNTLIYIPEHIPFPNIKEPKYIEAVIQEIETLIRVSHGHSLVLFTSYWLMERVYNTISSSVFPFPLYIMEKGRLDILSNYKKSRNGVLFASDSCGEGFDIAVIRYLISLLLNFLFGS